jgi:2-methylcitrate dehydratase PrpD
MDSSNILAEYIVKTKFEYLPAEVIDVTKKSVLDGTGIALAATTLGEQGVKEIVEMMTDSAQGKGESTIIGFGYKVPAWIAAFANGCLTHQLDYEDTYDPRYLHPSGAILPAAWAIAERKGNVSGKDFITAFAVACDVMIRLSLPPTRGLLEYNFFMPPTFGKYGAVIAAGKLLGLDKQQMVNAFGLVLHQASVSPEIAYSPGSSVRAIRDAFTNQAGVLSALLAQRGITGCQNNLDGKYGLYNICWHGDSDPAQLTADLGKRFENTGVSFKPWPCCRGCQVFVDATIRLVTENDIKPENVKEIKIVAGESMEYVESQTKEGPPKTSIDAKINLPFLVGKSIAHRDVSLEDFTTEGRQDPIALELARLVQYRMDNKYEAPGVEGGAMEIETKNGQKYFTETAFVGAACSINEAGELACDITDPTLTVTQEDLVKKFRDCARYSVNPMSAEKLDTLIHMLENLEEVRNMNEVMKLLA